MKDFDMKDFAPSYGDRKTGLRSAIWAALKYDLVPILFLVVVLSISRIFTSFLDVVPADEITGGIVGDVRTIGQMITDLAYSWITLVLIFSIPLVILAFFIGFYKEGSVPRLTFGTLSSVIFIVLVFLIVLGGDLESTFLAANVHVDWIFIFLILMIPLTLVALYHLGTYYDSQKDYTMWRLLKEGLPIPDEMMKKEEVEGHRLWHDFHLRYGTWRLSFKAAKKASLKYVVIIAIAFTIGVAIVRSLVGWANVDILEGQAEAIAEIMESYVFTLLLIGCLLTGLLFFKTFYPKGSFSRLIFFMASVLVMDLWIWTLGYQGNIDQSVADLIFFKLDFSGLLLIFIMLHSIWLIYAYVEYHSYRKDWKENHFQPVDDKLICGRKKAERKAKKAERKGIMEAAKDVEKTGKSVDAEKEVPNGEIEKK